MGHTQAPPQNLYLDLKQLGALTSSTANEQVYEEKNLLMRYTKLNEMYNYVH